MKYYAIMFVWNEADIIEATIKNILNQGFDRVYFIDNGSTDETIEKAKKAGGILAHEVDTGFFDEKVKLLSINTIIKHINERENDSSIWWLVVDADEFPDTGLGVSIRKYLECCPADANVVAADIINHIPTHIPYYLPGYHPIVFQPFAELMTYGKLPLVRYQKGEPHIAIMGGAHTYLTEDGSQLVGTRERLIYHHFPFRRPEVSKDRLTQLIALRPDGTRRVDKMNDYSLRNYNARSHYWRRLDMLADYYRENANKHIIDFPGDEYPSINGLWHGIHDVPEKFFPTSADYYFWKASIELYSKEYIADVLILFKELLRSKSHIDMLICAKAMEICIEKIEEKP